MKTLLIAVALISAPALAQSNYYETRFVNGNPPVVVQQANQPNGYYYNKSTNTYYKPKSINRDLYGTSAQGSLSYTYDRNQYAPQNLSIR
jgi:hypothetical protein